MLSRLSEKEVVKMESEIQEHELDAVFAQFKSAYDEVKSQALTPPEKLQLLQESFNEFGNEIRNRITVEEKAQVEAELPAGQNELVDVLSAALSQVVAPLASQIASLSTELKNVVKSTPATPVRRSIQPTTAMQADIKPQFIAPPSNSPTPKLHELIRKSVY